MVVQGSARASLVWIGLLGYVLYTYTGAAFAYQRNQFFLIYVAIFSLSVFALVTVLSGVDVGALQRRFDSGVPRRPVAVFLTFIGVMLALAELGEIIQFLITGQLPKIIVNSGGVTCFVYVLDIGIIFPLTVLSAVMLWRGMPWGYLLSGTILIKGATMGLALLSMELFSALTGQGTDGLEMLWAVIAFGSLGMSVWYFRHCRG